LRDAPVDGGNPTAGIKSPRNIKSNDVESFTPVEMGEIIKASEGIGLGPY